MDQNENLQSPSNGSKKGYIWITSIIFVLIIGAVGVFAYNHFVTNNPLVQYASVEKDTFEDLWSYKEDYYGDGLILDEKLVNDAYESSLTLSANAQLPAQFTAQDPATSSIIQGLISTFNIIFDTKVDPDNKEAHVNADITLQGNSLLSAEAYQNKEQTVLKVPALYDKYFSFENKKLGDFLRKNGEVYIPIEEIPNIIEYQQNALTGENLKQFTADYLDIVKDYVVDEEVKVKENVEYEGKKYTKLTLEFSEKEVQQILKDIFTEMKTDERLNQIFYTSNLREQVFTELLNQLDQLTLPNGVTYEAYFNKDFVAHRTLTMEIPDDVVGDTANMQFVMDTIMKENNAHLFNVALDLSYENVESDVVISYNEQGNQEGSQYIVDRVYGVDVVDEYVDEKMSLDATTVYEDNTAKTDFAFHYDGADVAEMPTISGFFNTTVNSDGEKAENTFELGIDFEMEDRYMGNIAFHIGLDGENKITFTDELDFPTIDKSNAVNVFDLSGTDAEQILYEMEQNATAYFEEMFGAFSSLGF